MPGAIVCSAPRASRSTPCTCRVWLDRPGVASSASAIRAGASMVIIAAAPATAVAIAAWRLPIDFLNFSVRDGVAHDAQLDRVITGGAAAACERLADGEGDVVVAGRAHAYGTSAGGAERRLRSRRRVAQLPAGLGDRAVVAVGAARRRGAALQVAI